MLPKKAGEQFAIGLLPKAFGLLENSHNTLMSWNSLQVFEPKLSEKHVKILPDNTTAVCYISYKEGTKSPSCKDITCDIWSLFIKNSTWLTTAHIPGVQNTDADWENIIFNGRTYRQLNPDLFSQIRDLWVTPEIDLFATRVNTQLAMLASWKPDPETTHIGAFSIDWSQYKFYCFPPFSHISRGLRKVEMDKTEGILIAPIWPTQVWRPQMLRLLTKHPVALPQQKRLLQLSKIHPLYPKLVLMACYISGDPMEQEEFQNQLVTSSWPPRDLVPSYNIKSISRNGLAFVLKGKLITINRL